MEYVHGESLAKLFRRTTDVGGRVDSAIAVTLVAQVLQGLHAAHEVKDESGIDLEVVHRDVSPQNVLVGADGVARVLDFGVAKALGRAQTTREGQIKGKIAYMSPEQLQGAAVDRRTDIFAASIVLWELLTGARLFGGSDEKTTIGRVIRCEIDAPSTRAPGLDAAIDAIVRKGLARDPADRYATAAEMATALEAWRAPAPASRIGAWVQSLSSEELTKRRARIEEIERSGSSHDGPGEPVVEGLLTKSALSVSGVETRRRDGRRIGVPLAILGVSSLAAALYLGARRPATAVAPPSAAPPITVNASASPPLPPPGPGASDSATLPPSSPAPPVSGSPSAAAAPGRRARPPAKPAASAKVDCTTPYVLDAEGRKRYKRECLHD